MFQEKGKYKLLEFIKEANETTEEFTEESTYLEEQLYLELCQYKGEEATNQGPYPLSSQLANIPAT